MDTFNWSYHSIAGAYLLGMTPHLIYYLKAMKTGKYTNLMPRNALDTLRGVIPAEQWNKLFKLRSLHMNAMESIPLFAATIIAGNIAKLPVSELNYLAAEYIGCRVAFAALYIGAGSEFTSYLRSGVWFYSLARLLYTLVKSGNAVSGLL
ncbi:hypothetical protein MGYG_07378 [Nannizzia gypsea CBS 118893]|uniref:MAPEG family protein n=1 Tax=Arthroderma gypseum (strain ATCC MYA-4604 / CBS 118893) TaxID=535722 RepID=E4V2Z6_ARTGP|nr:hypothetical protein MGYG_07378 [Nannizzia gypsea CBS 118893]EFR04370.1 hypothetical protein MGYG_07378 [Nannizzia gypsea CBS 118893]